MKLVCLALLLSVAAVSAQQFTVQGLELLGQRYGAAYPGYGVSNVESAPLNLNPSLYGSGMPAWSMAGSSSMPLNMQFGASQLPLSGGLEQSNVAALGASSLLGSGLAGRKKGQTTVAAPIYAQSMVVPKVITQPIYRQHLIQQPILQQQLIQQPIVETRQVIQPMIRRIITQPIIRPQIFESTTIQPTLKQETIVQPHLIEQTVVTPTMSNQFEQNQPIQEKAQTQVQQPVVQAPVAEKKQQGGLGMY